MEPETHLSGLPNEVSLVETQITLWREMTDDTFEEFSRRQYFGGEFLSRQQAIARLVDRLQELRRFPKEISDPEFPMRAQTQPETELTETSVNGETFLPVLLPPRKFPWHSWLMSVLIHALFLMIVLTIRLPKRRTALIDFRTEAITYYKISDVLPNISPSHVTRSQAQPKHSLAGKPSDEAASQTPADQEVQIHPELPKRTEIIVEQPDLKEVLTLPKLALPNILIQTNRIDPGREPITVTPQVAQDLQTVQQVLLKNLSLENQKPNVAEPLPMTATSQLNDARHSALNLNPYSTQKLNLELPVEPPSVTPQLSQLPSGPAQFGPRLTPLVAPPVEEPKTGFEVQQLPQVQGRNLMVYSADPVIPPGKLAIPKVNSTGRIATTPSPPGAKSLPAGAAEISQTEIVIPSVSIKGPAPINPGGPGVAIIQAPIPPKPQQEPVKKTKEERPASLLDMLPSRIPSRNIPSSEGWKTGTSTDSPLQDYERQGGPVYTAAINAPNFTSKRGSWIFRFAELLDSNSGEPPPVKENGENSTAPQLTAPSATVKVDPKYPPEAIREKVEGVVILFAILRKDGSIDPESVRVIRKLDPRLDINARDALLRWKFKPSLKNGNPVDIQTEITIPFYLRREEL